MAGLLYCGVWWKADSELYLKLMLHTPFKKPVESSKPDAIAGAGRPGGGAEPRDGRVDRSSGARSRTRDVGGYVETQRDEVLGAASEEDQPPAESTAASGVRPDPGRYSASTVQVVLPASAYGWLTLATLSACAVALSGAAAVARGTEFDLRRVGFILGGGVLLALAWGVATTWADYGREYKPHHLRFAMSAPVAISACLGLILSSRARLFSRVAGISLIFAAIGSVVALWLGHRCEAVDAAQVTISFLTLVFTAHSAWGWILLFLGPRWVR